MQKLELLSPAGNLQKAKTAFHFGADAVYCAGKNFGLRSGAGNLDLEELKTLFTKSRAAGKKTYVTLNIYAKNKDFDALPEYATFLESAGANGVIVSDLGVLSQIKKHAPKLDIHISTQANTINKYTAKFYADLGVKRVVVARELSLEEISEIKQHVGDSLELEAFCHGAMCVSYSGRCLVSNYITGKDANRGECVQPCRWEWQPVRNTGLSSPIVVEEDARGTYLFNSVDLKMVSHLNQMVKAGITSFKIEGRMKSEFYVGATAKAYRTALDMLPNMPPEWVEQELKKVSHRTYGTGFFFAGAKTEDTTSAKYTQNSQFLAQVVEYDKENGELVVEQRNRFAVGDTVEVLSANPKWHNKQFTINKMSNLAGDDVVDARLVQQQLRIKTDMELQALDILRTVGVSG